MNEVPDAPLGGVDHGDPFDDPDDGYDFIESEKATKRGHLFRTMLFQPCRLSRCGSSHAQEMSRTWAI